VAEKGWGAIRAVGGYRPLQGHDSDSGDLEEGRLLGAPRAEVQGQVQRADVIHALGPDLALVEPEAGGPSAPDEGLDGGIDAGRGGASGAQREEGEEREEQEEERGERGRKEAIARDDSGDSPRDCVSILSPRELLSFVELGLLQLLSCVQLGLSRYARESETRRKVPRSAWERFHSTSPAMRTPPHLP